MKKKPRDPFPDPPEVAEVRRWRAKMVKRAGGTVQGLMDHLRKLQTEGDSAAAKPTPRRRKSA